YILGFTPDDVVVGWQDSRLAGECVRAWEAEGRPADFQLLQGSGDGKHLVLWFLNPSTVALLDRRGIEWRSFIVGERFAPPSDARNALTTDPGSLQNPETSPD